MPTGIERLCNNLNEIFREIPRISFQTTNFDARNDNLICLTNLNVYRISDRTLFRV